MFYCLLAQFLPGVLLFFFFLIVKLYLIVVAYLADRMAHPV